MSNVHLYSTSGNFIATQGSYLHKYKLSQRMLINSLFSALDIGLRLCFVLSKATNHEKLNSRWRSQIVLQFIYFQCYSFLFKVSETSNFLKSVRAIKKIKSYLLNYKQNYLYLLRNLPQFLIIQFTTPPKYFPLVECGYGRYYRVTFQCASTRMVRVSIGMLIGV